MGKRLYRWGNLNDQYTFKMVSTSLGIRKSLSKPHWETIPYSLDWRIFKSDNSKARKCSNKSFQKLVAVNIGPNTLENSLVWSNNTQMCTTRNSSLRDVCNYWSAYLCALWYTWQEYAVLLIIVSNWILPKCPSTIKWIDKLFIHIME